MIIFELTFPNRGSWNGKWSGEKDRHMPLPKPYKPKEEINENDR